MNITIIPQIKKIIDVSNMAANRLTTNAVIGDRAVVIVVEMEDIRDKNSLLTSFKKKTCT